MRGDNPLPYPLLSTLIIALGLQGCGLSNGNGDQPQPITPVSQVITAISGNENGTLITSGKGHLYVTGLNKSGVLGLGAAEQQITAFRRVDVESFGQAISFSTIQPNYTALSNEDNTSFAIGNHHLFSTGDNAAGQQGLGDVITRGQFTDNPITDGISLATIHSIAGSNQFSLALSNSGEIWGSGFRSDGVTAFDPYGSDTQTAITTLSSLSWVKIHVNDAGNPVAFSRISAAGLSAYYIDSTGTLWVAGDNRFCQLGTQCGTAAIIPAITKVVINDPSGNPVRFKDVFAAKNGALLIDQNDTLWAAGANAHNRFSGLAARYDVFTHIPIQDAGGRDIHFTSVSVSDNTTIAISDTGTAYGAGMNTQAGLPYTLLGLPITVTDQNAFVALQIPVEAHITMAEARATHTILLDANNILWVIGDNEHGQLGTSDTVSLFAFRGIRPVLY